MKTHPLRLFAILVVASLLSSAVMVAEVTAVELDAYGGWKGLQGTKTGFFHIEEIDGRTWFITPEGNVFFAIGLSHLLLRESNAACDSVYGGDRGKWLRDSFAKAKEMGFNCALGSATSPERNPNGFVDVDRAEQLFREYNFPYAVGVILLKHPWELVEGETLPDIFDPACKSLIDNGTRRNEVIRLAMRTGFSIRLRNRTRIGHASCVSRIRKPPCSTTPRSNCK